MSKLDHIAEGRTQGLAFARALCEGSVTWYDITETLKAKTGIEIDLSDENIAGKG